MRPLTVGILGCGHIAPRHVDAWRRSPRFDLRGLFDLDPDAVERLRHGRPSLEAFRSSDELIAACDVVDICTPPATHFPLIKSAIQAGRHLVVEKPVVIDEDDWRAISALLAGHGATFSVVHHLKFTRAVETAKHWLESGRLGRLLRIESHFATHPDVDRMLGGQPHWSHDLPGGRWFETLPHNLYLTHHLAGPLRLDGVTAVATAGAPTGVRADEVVVSLAGPTTLGTIHFSARCRHNYRHVILVGSEAIVRIDLLSDAVNFDRVPDLRGTRGAGRLFLNSLAALGRWPLDRAVYGKDRLVGRTPHARFVERLGEHLASRSEPPTSRGEIEYTVENCYRIGAAIDDSVNARGANAPRA